MSSKYYIVETGAAYSKNYRVYFLGPTGFVSPFHDIPLHADSSSETFNMVVEIPRWTNAKMEINKEEPLNPIKQDVKKDKPRFVDNCFPYHGYIWNYGALPQTWEDPSYVDPHTEQRGDNDPIDVCEIGSKVHKRGAVVQVKVLGIMALIDEGETDWKIIAIDVTDPLADKLNDIADVENLMPGILKATNEWFRIYKIPTGKPENKFAFNGEAKDKAFALNIIKESHEQWRKALHAAEKNDKFNITNTTLEGSAQHISQNDSRAIVDPKVAEPAHAIPPEVDTWHYVKL